VARAGERAHLDRQARGLQRGDGGVARAVHTRVVIRVHGEHGGLRPGEVGRGRCRPVEGCGRGDARLARGEQLPRHAAPEAEADDADLLARHSLLHLVDRGTHVGHQTGGRRGAERADGLRVAAERGGAALLGEQVDRERGVAVGREPGRDRADVVGEATVLVDHEHRALGARRRGPGALQLAVRPREPDGLARAGRRGGRGRGGRRRRRRAELRFRRPRRRGAGAVVGSAAARGDQRAGRGDTQSEQTESSQCFATRELTVDEVERDFFLQITAQRHVETLPNSTRSQSV
jgi:hypothetical protein